MEMATLKGLSLIHQPLLSVPLILLVFQNRELGLHCTFFKIQQINLIYTPKTTNLQAFKVRIYCFKNHILYPLLDLVNYY